MRAIALFASVLLLAPATGAAQSSAAPTGSQAQQRDALIRIEREIAQANFDCDYRYFERVEATEFTFTDAQGKVSDRKEDLAGESSCKKSKATATIDSADVRLYGMTAVLVARSTINSTSRDGQPEARRSRFTDVFVWRDGRWQLVAGHSSRLP
jgi:ketosteroid isomerase-like protein